MTFFRYFFFTLCLCFFGAVFSQAIPSELADLSLQMSESRTGTIDLSDQDVLFKLASGEARSNSNYPVLPTTITPQVHSFSLAYQLSSKIQLSLSVPYTMQLGSGTFDFPVSLADNHYYKQFNYGAHLVARIRTGKNKQGYKLGNNYNALLWSRYMTVHGSKLDYVIVGA